MNKTKWTSQNVRKTFINYFVDKHIHAYEPSSSVLPYNDPTLLFVNAGMNQFKSIFLGKTSPDSSLYKLKRAVNSQKCIRAGGKHNDLDDVGKDTYHHTFFEMLGNWSFGDYFKKEAINWAWDLLVNLYGLNKEKLYATYFEGNKKLNLKPDNETRDIWLDYLPSNRVLPFGVKDNFWEMGETGPCGPCSEIHYDMIGERDATKLVNANNSEVIEIWNLVFMQYNRKSDSSLELLPNKHVDTGMGLERITAILQGKKSNYDTDLFTPIFEEIQKITKFPHKYSNKQNNYNIAYRIIADHIRTLVIAISDGILPDSTGRGYVIRRILRRALRIGKLNFNIQTPFLYQLVPCVIDIMKSAFDISKKVDFIKTVIMEEEINFIITLDKGEKHLSKLVSKLRNEGKNIISGKMAFILYSRYGFPIDLIKIASIDHGLTVDIENFEKEREKDVLISKMAKKNSSQNQLKLGIKEINLLKNEEIKSTDYQNVYQHQNIKGKILQIYTEQLGFVNQFDEIDKECGLILDKTSFYPEMGGQIYDTGKLYLNEEIELKVKNCQIYGGYILHTATLIKGVIKVGINLKCDVDYLRRRFIATNHTYTHVLNHSLREVIGEGLDQKGSRVLENKFTFDFNSSPIPYSKLMNVESFCVRKLDSDLQVYTENVALETALKIKGIRAVFGENYPDPVRVVSIGKPIREIINNINDEDLYGYSIELCGGTHMKNTNKCIAFVISSENGIAKGIRRIECYTGNNALKSISKGKSLMEELNKANLLKDDELDYFLSSYEKFYKIAMSNHPDISIPYSVSYEIREMKSLLRKKNIKWLNKERKRIEKDSIAKIEKDMRENVKKMYNVSIINDMKNPKMMQRICETVFKKYKIAIMLIGFGKIKKKDRVIICCYVPGDYVKKYKINAKDWISNVVIFYDGIGNGNHKFAQGQGVIKNNMNHGIKLSKEYIEKRIKSRNKELK